MRWFRVWPCDLNELSIDLPPSGCLRPVPLSQGSRWVQLCAVPRCLNHLAGCQTRRGRSSQSQPFIRHFFGNRAGEDKGLQLKPY